MLKKIPKNTPPETTINEIATWFFNSVMIGTTVRITAIITEIKYDGSKFGNMALDLSENISIRNIRRFPRKIRALFNDDICIVFHLNQIIIVDGVIIGR
jgi:hypothetical protein